MAYDSERTRQRLLDAAFDEFVDHGLAGARVDRIARSAKANKQAIYAYFGSKEALFDAVLEQRLELLVSAVPLTPDDLAGYAAAMYDYLEANPDYLRLNNWKRLERPDARPDEVASYEGKLAKIRAATPVTNGRWTEVNLLLTVLGIANAWHLAPPAVRQLDDTADDAERARRQRAAVIDAVHALLKAAGAAPTRD